jgi:hypothetical protein
MDCVLLAGRPRKFNLSFSSSSSSRNVESRSEGEKGSPPVVVSKVPLTMRTRAMRNAPQHQTSSENVVSEEQVVVVETVSDETEVKRRRDSQSK